MKDTKFFDFIEFEKFIYQDDIATKEEGLRYIDRFLETCINNGWSYPKLRGLGNTDAKLAITNQSILLLKVSTRLGNGIGDFIMSIEVYNSNIQSLLKSILRKKRLLISIFGASIYSNTDYLVVNLIKRYQVIKNPSNEELELFFLKLAILYNINSLINIDQIYKYFSNSKFYVTHFLLGLLSQRLLPTETSQNNKKWLVDQLSSLIKRVNIFFESEDEKLAFLNSLPSYYKNCSNKEKKSESHLREELYEMIRRSNIGNQLYEFEKIYSSIKTKNNTTNKDRKILFILLESTEKTNRLMNLYSKFLKKLKKDFFTIGIFFNNQDVNQRENKIFDKQYIISEKSIEENLNVFIYHLEQFKPEGIYYPSIGQDPYIILVSAFKLAKKQIYSLGYPHPAMNPLMDGLITTSFDDDIIEKDIHSEHIIINEFHYEQINNEDLYTSKTPWKLEANGYIDKENNEKVKIGIIISSEHLTYDFIEVIKNIEINYRNQYELYFFSEEYKQIINSEIINLLNSEFKEKPYLLSTKEHNLFIENLKKCDLVLWPFYFGNYSYIIDSYKNGIIGPYLITKKTYIEKEIENLYLKLNLKNFLATSKEEYQDIMYELINARINKESNRLASLSKQLQPSSLNNFLTMNTKNNIDSNTIIRKFID